jgi:hypothetical protein
MDKLDRAIDRISSVPVALFCLGLMMLLVFVFACVKCKDCGHEYHLAFSCK